MSINIWNAQTIAHKTMKDLPNNPNIFNTAMILLFDDFCQTLPIIPQSTAAGKLNECLKSNLIFGCM